MEQFDFMQKLPGRLNEFRLLQRQALDHREQFWSGQAGRLNWHKNFTAVVQEDFSKVAYSWFCNGRINAAENALNRPIEQGLGDQTALIFYRQAKDTVTYTFNELKEEVLKLAAAFQKNGLKEGDCIALILPHCPEFVITALAAAYLGITYLPIGGHLPAEVAASDVKTSRSRLIIMANRPEDSDGHDHAKAVYDLMPSIDGIVVGEKLGDLKTFSDYMSSAPSQRPEPAYPLADHPLFAIYGNRLSGKHMGAVFSTGGFLVQAHTSFDLIFNQALSPDKPETLVTAIDLSKGHGQAYGLWGPLLNGTPIMMTQDAPEKQTIEYILENTKNPALICRPTLLSDIRSQLGSDTLNSPNRFSVVACCEDALPPRLIKFAAGTLVQFPERVVNLWVQSKSGTALIHTYPSPGLNQPGALGFGALGVEPLTMSDLGQPCKTNVSGNLVFAGSWPAMAKPTFGTFDHFKKRHFCRFPGYFLTYDGVRSDQDGFFWFMERLDNVLKIKGQSLDTSLIETMISAHPDVNEAAVIGVPGPSGEELAAFVVPRKDIEDDQRVMSILSDYICEKIGDFAVPEKIIITKQMPRTVTGKLFRPMLRRMASEEDAAVEDTGLGANSSPAEDLEEK